MSDYQLVNLPCISEFKEFSDVRVFGTPEVPLFVSKDVERMLQIKNIKYNRDYVENEDYVKIKIPYDSQVREINAFTEHGLYQVIYRTRSPVGDKFRKFVTLVLKELRINKVVTLETALNKLVFQLNEEHKLQLQYKKESEGYFHKWQDSMYKTMNLESQISSRNLWNRGSPEYELQQMKEEFYSKWYIYLERIPKNYTGDHIEEYDTEDDLGEEDERLFTISKTARKYEEAAIAYVHPKVTIKDIETALEHLRPDPPIGKKHYYHTCLNTLTWELSNVKPIM